MARNEGSKMPRPGFLVTFEGIEGSGKSTQVDRLADHLKRMGREVLKTREPGGTPIGDRVRSILLDPTHEEMSPKTELYLILASRAQHVAQVIRPAISGGKIVLCDRFIHATIAYQGYGRGLRADFVEAACVPASDRVSPRVVFLLDVDVATAMKRLAHRGPMNRIDREAIGFHEQVRKGYLKMASRHHRLIRKIDASQPIDVVAQAIQKGIHPYLAVRHV